MKSIHLGNLDRPHSNNNNNNGNADDDNANEDVVAGKKRKNTESGNNDGAADNDDDDDDGERTFEITRWVPVPQERADRMEQRKYLADRRPGMG